MGTNQVKSDLKIYQVILDSFKQKSKEKLHVFLCLHLNLIIINHPPLCIFKY